MMRKFVFVLTAVIGLMAGGRAQADPITSIDGINAGFQLSSPGAGATNVATVTFNGNFTTQLNHVLTGFDPTYIISVSFNTIGTAVTGGTQYLFNPTSYPNGEKIFFASGTATFDLVGVDAFVPDAKPNTMVLSGTLKLVGNTSSLDLSPFQDPNSTFTFTLQTATELMNNLIANGNNPGQNQTGSASFSEADPPVVPEPSSMLLLGLGSMGMVGYAYRRRNRLALA